MNGKLASLRMAGAPASIRAAIVIASAAALLLAYPHPSVLLAAAVLPAAMPRSFVPTAFMLGTAVLWLAETQADAGLLTLWRVCALALALYYVHAGAALAAVLPRDAVLTPGTVGPWLSRIGLVSVLTIGVAAVVESVSVLHDGTHTTILATMGGVVLLITAAVFLVYLGKRRI